MSNISVVFDRCGFRTLIAAGALVAVAALAVAELVAIAHVIGAVFA